MPARAPMIKTRTKVRALASCLTTSVTAAGDGAIEMRPVNGDVGALGCGPVGGLRVSKAHCRV
eukprot:16318600-Heterocapsa_arctica.AAC.1